MSATFSVAIAAVAVFVSSSVWYAALAPVEVRVLGPAAPGRGGRPSGVKALLELTRSVLLGAVIAGVARACGLRASARRCCSGWRCGWGSRLSCSPAR